MPNGSRGISTFTNGVTTRLRIENAANTEWIDADFVWNSGTSTLTIGTIYSSSVGGTAVTFSSGAKSITHGPMAIDIDRPDAATGANIASAATLNLDARTGGRVHVTGSTGITAVTLTRGPVTVIFDAALVLTHHATNNKLPGAANITTAAGDVAVYESDGTTVFVSSFTKANGRAVVSAGIDGATSTGAVTLTAASAYAQKIAPTAAGQSVKLPDATTMLKGLAFSIWNDSDFYVRVLDSTSVLRSLIPPRATMSIALSDNAAAIGEWNFTGAALVGVTARLNVTTIAQTGDRCQAITLDADRQMIVFGGVSTGAIYAVCYNSTTNTWGTPVLVRSSATYWRARLAATDKVLIVSCNATTGMEGVIVSVSTLTATTNTAATATLAGNCSDLYDLGTTSQGFIVPYSRVTTTQGIRAITVSGNTVAFGAETALSSTGTGQIVLVASGAIVIAIGTLASGSTGYVKPYTQSGTTLSAGTATTFGTVITSTEFDVIALGARWVVLYGENSVTTDAILVSLSGTTVTKTTVTSVFAVDVTTAEFDLIVALTNFSATVARFASSYSLWLISASGSSPTVTAQHRNEWISGTTVIFKDYPSQIDIYKAYVYAGDVAVALENNGNELRHICYGMNETFFVPTEQFNASYNPAPGRNGSEIWRVNGGATITIERFEGAAP